jgi:DNA-binding NtrC family response regulator
MVSDASDFDDAATAIRAENRYVGAASAAFDLVVVEGPDRGTRVEIDAAQPSPVLVGQSPACALRLTDRHISRRHASFEVAGARVRLKDLGSTNGTLVENVNIVEAFVSPGETVRMGSTMLGIERRLTDATPPPEATNFGRFVGASPVLRRLYPLLTRLARSRIPIVIEGETGTGKEVLAEALHEASPRADGPYVVFDCTAVPPSLVEAELFGHERGAFTGAAGMRRGVFELAHGGTLLIDEIGDLDLSMQPKLLRALESSEIRRIGSEQSIQLDVRIIAATRRDLDHEVQEGRFRDDLFYRLAVGRVALPPLREREGDIRLLANHFWRALGGSGPPPAEALARWAADPWSGNVRALRNAIARYFAVGELGLDPNVSEPMPGETHDVIEAMIRQRAPLPIGRLRVVAEYERRYIESVLAEHGGNVSSAAAASGVGRRYFQILRARTRSNNK